MFKNITFKDETVKDNILQMIDDMKTDNEKDNIHIDLADIKTVLESKGVISIKTFENTGEDALEKALSDATKSFKHMKLNAVLVLFVFSQTNKIDEFAIVVNKYIFELGDDETDIIFGISKKNSFKETQVKVTVLANEVDTKE